jgi:uncharacterized membrane protein YsdA (DUF1294 family)
MCYFETSVATKMLLYTHMPLIYPFIGVLALINLVAFIIMTIDKRRSIRGDPTERIPEGLLFFMAVAFGSVGVYAGMLLLRHKTRKWYFVIGIPLLIAQNCACLYLLVFFLKLL